MSESYKKLLLTLRPDAAFQATRWFIGSNGNVYKGDDRVGEGDTSATAISIGSNGDRIWTVGQNRRVYTYGKLSGTWDDFGVNFTADNILLVRKIGTGQDHMFLLDNGNMVYRCWDESQSGWPKFVADAPCPLVPIPLAGIKALAATGRGAAFYLIDSTPPTFGVWDSVSLRRHKLPPALGDARGLTANEDRLYVYSSTAIASVSVLKALGAAGNEDLPWNMMKLPSEATLKNLFASPDGTLLAILGDQRMYFCCDDEGDLWRETDGNTAQKAVMWPLHGWEMFAYLESEERNTPSPN